MRHTSLPPSHLEALRKVGRSRRYERNDVLFCEGERSSHVVVINQGNVRITTIAETGYTSLLALRGEGEIVGEMASIDGRERSATVTAVDSVAATIVPAEGFRAALAASPDLLFAFLNLLVSRQRQSDRRILEFGAYTAGDRISLVLLDLLQTYGQPVPNEPGAVFIKVTQTELAGAAGVSRESAARALRKLAADGVLRTGRRRLIVTDLARLTRSTAGPPTYLDSLCVS
jgi:CRP-like cAMP-binding protein